MSTIPNNLIILVNPSVNHEEEEEYGRMNEIPSVSENRVHENNFGSGKWRIKQNKVTAQLVQNTENYLCSHKLVTMDWRCS
jgi:hypothetical protein